VTYSKIFRAVIPEQNIEGHTFTFEALARKKPLFSIREIIKPWLQVGNEPDQYIGIKDKNDRMIFEHDIINYHGENREVVYCNNYACGEYELRKEDEAGILSSSIDNWSALEVIGNIYYNEELLEGDK